MECSERPVWTNYMREELTKIQIQAPDEAVRERVKAHWDAIAKPLDSMGRFESLIAQLGAVMRTDQPDIGKRAVLILCSDNGIVEEGISQCGQEVTLAVARSMAEGNSSVGRMAKAVGADTIPVDMGIQGAASVPGLLDRKIRQGTRNFRREPAMTECETVRAVAQGIDLVYSCKAAGYRLLATGEMGIGNTTTSSAVTAALLRCDAELVTGRGAGLSDAGLARKRQIVAEAIERYDLYHADALTVLAAVGGFDIAGLAGICIGGALCRVPIVLDGFISLAAALVAERLVPGTKAYLIPSHKGKEPGTRLLERELGLEPVIDGNMALGEGTGAVMMFALLDLALSVYRTTNTFSDIRISQYERLGGEGGLDG